MCLCILINCFKSLHHYSAYSYGAFNRISCIDWLPVAGQSSFLNAHWSIFLFHEYTSAVSMTMRNGYITICASTSTYQEADHYVKMARGVGHKIRYVYEYVKEYVKTAPIEDWYSRVVLYVLFAYDIISTELYNVLEYLCNSLDDVQTWLTLTFVVNELYHHWYIGSSVALCQAIAQENADILSSRKVKTNCNENGPKYHFYLYFVYKNFGNSDQTTTYQPLKCLFCCSVYIICGLCHQCPCKCPNT